MYSVVGYRLNNKGSWKNWLSFCLSEICWRLGRHFENNCRDCDQLGQMLVEICLWDNLRDARNPLENYLMHNWFYI